MPPVSRRDRRHGAAREGSPRAIPCATMPPADRGVERPWPGCIAVMRGEAHVAVSEPLKEIPHPPTKPFVGNLFDLDREHPMEGVKALAREYGPIFRLSVPGRTITIVSGYSLTQELADESRFE